MIFALATDFTMAVEKLPLARPKHRILRLLEEALLRDIHFIARHPTALFQSFWNLCWWYDCPQSMMHYRQPDIAPAMDVSPTDPAPNIFEMMEIWYGEKERSMPGFRWLRSLRPPDIPLNTTMKAMLRGHARRVETVAWSPDGRAIASGAVDRTARIWEPTTGECLLVLNCSAEVNQVSWSPNSKCLACGCSDAIIALWDVTKHQQLGTLCTSDAQQIREGVTDLSWSPDGLRIAASYGDGHVCIWDVQSSQIVLSLPQHTHRVWSVAWSPDGTQLATANVDHVVNLWALPGGKLLRTLLGSTQYLACVKWSPDGSYIAAGGGDSQITIWTPDTGAIHCTLRGPSAVHSLAWLGTGDWMVSCGLDRIVRVWDVNGKTLLQEHSGHTGIVNSVTGFPGEYYFATGSRDCRVGIWNAKIARRTNRLRCETSGSSNVSWSPDGKHIAISGIGQSISVFGLGNVVAYFELSGSTQEIRSAEWSPDSEYIVSDEKDGRVILWNVNTRSRIYEFTAGGTLGQLGWSPNGGIVFYTLDDHRLLRFNKLSQTRRLQPLSKLESYRNRAFGVVSKLINVHAQAHRLDYMRDADRVIWAPNGKRIAIENRDVGTGEARIRIVDTGSARVLFTFPEILSMMGWSPDGRWIFTLVPGNKMISLWNAADFQLVYTWYPKKGDRFRMVQFSSDSAIVAAENSEGEIEIRTSATWEVLDSCAGRPVTLPNDALAPFCVQQDPIAVSIGSLDGHPPFIHFPLPSGFDASDYLMTDFSFRYWAVVVESYFVLFRLEGTPLVPMV